MQLCHIVLKVSNIVYSRQWYSSLLFDDPTEVGEGYCTWKGGITIVSKDKWKELFLMDGDDMGVPSTSFVMEVPSFDNFLRILSCRNDRSSIVVDEGFFFHSRSVKLMDPDMNIIIVVESDKDYATLADYSAEGRIYEEKGGNYRRMDKTEDGHIQKIK